MRVLKLSVAYFLIFFSAHLLAQTTTLTLQNGTNGYDGCSDAHVWDGYYENSLDNENFGEEEDLIEFFGNDGSYLNPTSR